MTLPISRRGLFGHAGAFLGLGLLAGSGRALAQPGLLALPPEAGQTVTMSLDGFGGTLVVNLPPPLPKLDFIGSRVVKILSGGTDFVSLQVSGFVAEAAHPKFGKVTLRQPDADPGPNGILALAPDGAGLIEVWRQGMDITFERCGDCPGPFRFSTLEPAEWTAHLPEFPPPRQGTTQVGAPTGGARYRMTRPLRFGAQPGAQSVAEPAACRCALQAPLRSSNPATGLEYARIESLDFRQGRRTG